MLLPDPKKATYEGIVDAAGQPFYFDGRPKFIYNLAAFGPFGPKTISGKTPVSSGGMSPQGPKAPPATATYTFPQAGSFKLVCTLHPGMEARVVVKPAGAAVPKTPAQVQAQALLQQTAGWAKGKALLASTKVAPNTVAMGVGGKIDAAGLPPEGAQGEGRHDRVLPEQVAERGAQPRLRPAEVRREAPEADRPVPAGPDRRRTR